MGGRAAAPGAACAAARDPRNRAGGGAEHELPLPRTYQGLEVLPDKGTIVARDGDTVWRTPYDDCVMVMPSMVHLKPGTTMLRLGSYV